MQAAEAPALASTKQKGGREPIAIIAMAGRFPGASSVEQLWQNLRDGVEAIRPLRDADLRAAGVSERWIDHPNYVKVGAALDAADEFDAGYFGYTPREAEITDPQQRVFLECSVEALERAGYDPSSFEGAIGVFAGTGASTYWQQNLARNPAVEEASSPLQVLVANEKDFIATRVAYKLNLRGPAVNVQSACSTSLTAVHMACQSLLDDACEIAIAGGVSIRFPQNSGYLYEDQSIGSPDGHCRAFDADARGTVPGNGVGLVVLKRLSRAVEDRDPIEAVILGSAINNDGSNKVGYTAPSVDGQAAVIRAAQEAAGVDPDSITYVEAHGTGTQLGDPIELAALHKAFGPPAASSDPCAIGSIKTNLGHLDVAAGVTGLIKTALQLKNAELVPSLHFRKYNEKIDFSHGRFFVNTETRPWNVPASGKRRAGVSSFGIGGTNAHLILEEPPVSVPTETAGRDWCVLPLSAKTAAALDRRTEELADYLAGDSAAPLPDVAYTLQVGRTEHRLRRSVAARNPEEAVTALRALVGKSASSAGDSAPKTVFLFPGQGAQFVGMGRELYETEETFRSWMRRCAELFQSVLEGAPDLCDLLYPEGEAGDAERALLKETWLTQPALFAIEYSLAQLWMSWGLRPAAMIGHSVGEYVAACIAGALTIEEAVRLVAVRGKLMHQTASGLMLAAPLSEAETRELMGRDLCLASINAPRSCVVAGSVEAIQRFAALLEQRGTPGRVLETSRAFHSRLMEPILEEFASHCRTVRWQAPSVPWISNVTGNWITELEVQDPTYWTRHLRETVQFSSGVRTVLNSLGAPARLLEVGPGETLVGLARKQRSEAREWWDAISIPWPSSPVGAARQMAETLGRLWETGVRVSWRGYHAEKQGKRTRVLLPTYPFQRQRYWIEPAEAGLPSVANGARKSDIADWFYVPGWQRFAPAPAVEPPGRSNRWLVFAHHDALGEGVLRGLGASGQSVVAVYPGDRHRDPDGRSYQVRPASPADFVWLLDELAARGETPDRIAHLWAAGAIPSHEDVHFGYGSLLHLGQALSVRSMDSKIRIAVVTAGVYEVIGGERIASDRALVAGPRLVLPAEEPNVQARLIDLDLDQASGESQALVAALLREEDPDLLALRRGFCWAQRMEAYRCEAASIEPRAGGVYLITGGIGSMGLEIACSLAQRHAARLVLISRCASDDARGRAEQAVQKIASLGGEALFCAADVADRDQLRVAIATAKERFGSIHGVIHAAGLPGGGLLSRLTLESASAVFAPKVDGTRNLIELLAGEPLDFALLCSSQRSLLGAPGRAEYCASNAWLNAYAVEARQWGFRAPLVSVAWGSWREMGMGAVEADANEFRDALSAELYAFVGPDICYQRIPRRRSASTWASEASENEKGVEVFRRLLAQPHPVVVVSTHDWSFVEAEHRDLTIDKTTDLLGKGADEQLERHARPDLASDFVAPRTPTEKALAEIWGRLLGIDRIGVEDNFFDLGGDSVISIQVISRANEAGLKLTPRQVFEHQTIAELAAVAGQGALIQAEQGLVAGLVPLTPIQRWFFEQRTPEPNYFHQAVLIEADHDLDSETLEQALQELVRHHDIVRTRFSPNGREWQAEIEAPSACRLLQVVSGSGSPDAFEQVYRSMDLDRPPLLRAALFQEGPRQTSRILLAIHHLVVDLVSWRILLEDLENVYNQLIQWQSLRLPMKTTSFQAWAEKLGKEAAAGTFDDELAFWMEHARRDVRPLPTDLSRASAGATEGSAAIVSFDLGKDATRSLLLNAPQALDAHLHEVLLGALAGAIQEWSGHRSVLVDLEGLGREALFDDVDLSRTVGWFTPLYPVLVDCAGDGRSGLVESAKKAVRSVPRHGIGYGALRYSTDRSEAFAGLPAAEVCFLWQGQAGGSSSMPGNWRRASADLGRTHASSTPLSHLLSVNGMVVDGVATFQLIYSRDLHHPQTIEDLAASFERHIRDLLARPSPRPTAAANPIWTDGGMSDFDWSESDISEIAAALENAGGSSRPGGDRT